MKSSRMCIAHAGLVASLLGMAHAVSLRSTKVPLGDNSKCNIFALWNYPTPAPLHIRLNVETWRRHSHARCNEPTLITDKNVFTYIPDMPAEYFELYPAARSDMVRYGVLYHHGGIYMDTDVLVTKDMSSIVDAVGTHDLVSYTDQVYPHEGKETGPCARYSSNIMGARKGSSYMKSVWDTQKKLLRRQCHENVAYVNTESEPCCYNRMQFNNVQKKGLDGRRCHIPWGSLNTWAHDDGEKKAVDNSFCFQNAQSFLPFNFTGVMETVQLQAGMAAWQAQGVTNALDRGVYHMFNQLFPKAGFTCEKIFDANTLYGYLYAKSFKGTQAVPDSPSRGFFLNQHPDFKTLGCHFVPR